MGGIKSGLLNSFGMPIVSGPLGQPYAMHDADGSVRAVRFEGATQKHPQPYRGGFKLDLSSNGPMREDATDGYIQTLGNTAQTSAGLVQTLNAGQTDTIIDLPGMGTIYAPSQVMLGLSIVNGTPGGGGDRAGFQLSNNRVAYTLDCAAFYLSGGPWRHGISLNGGGWNSGGSPGGVLAADVADIDYVSLCMISGLTSAFAQSYSLAIGEEGNLEAFQATGGTLSTLFFRNDIPDTYDFSLRAAWTGGDDMIVAYKYIMILPQPTLSLTD